MKVLLLAAGLGTRLSPITQIIPKCLAPINGVPLLFYWLDSLYANEDIETIIVNTHYISELVSQLIAKSPYRDKVTIIHEKELLGTAGTIKAVSDYLQGGPAMVVHSDNYSLFNLADFQKAYQQRPAESQALLMSFATNQPHTCGILDVDDNELINGFFEKVENPPGNLANAAVYIFGEQFLSTIYKSSNEINDISTQILPNYLARMSHWQNRVYHRDIGNYESLLLAQLEGPTVKTLPFISNIWQGFWLADAGKNFYNLVARLAESLNYPVVSLKDEINPQVNYIIVLEKWSNDQVSAWYTKNITNDARTNTNFSANTLLIIGVAPRDINAKKIRERYGIKSLILSITEEL